MRVSVKMHNDKVTHVPVLLEESTKLLITDKNGIYLDATLGLAGHSKYFLGKLGLQAKIIAFDRDRQAIETARENLKDYLNRVTLIHANFADASKFFETLKITSIDGAFFDLGFSSHQIENGTRGFSFNKEGPLDMRFDDSSRLTAKEIVNTYSYEQLKYIIENYGEKRHADRITKEIIRKRKMSPIETTTQLAILIENAIRRRGKIHPATRTFQALRIAVNNELYIIQKGLEGVSKLIKRGGRIAVISFHSLEDRIVKQFFKKLCQTKHWVLINKKPIIPAEKERQINPRSRSAKLRVIERKT
jgi:16S rRNA (cytosine1402-N4)-methyltransferase